MGDKFFRCAGPTNYLDAFLITHFQSFMLEVFGKCLLGGNKMSSQKYTLCGII